MTKQEKLRKEIFEAIEQTTLERINGVNKDAEIMKNGIKQAEKTLLLAEKIKKYVIILRQLRL